MFIFHIEIFLGPPKVQENRDFRKIAPPLGANSEVQTRKICECDILLLIISMRGQ